MTMTPAQYTGLVAAIQVGLTPMNIGGTVTGGTATRVLYVGAGPVLADSAAFTFNGTSGVTVTNGLFTATLGNSVGAYAGYFTDATRTTLVCQGSAAIQATDGVRTVTICDGTNSYLYVPTTAADWNGAAPTDVVKALDRCAALLKTLNGGTGP